MNAIILAAGQGKRLKGTCYEGIPKSLIRLANQKSSIEILIDLLDRESKIDKIYIIVGYKSELFYYLMDRSNKVILVYNEDYKKSSNQYSLEKMNNYPVEDSIIIDADTVIIDNTILNNILSHFNNIRNNYVITCDKLNSESEWVVESNEFKMITSVKDNNIGYNEKHITSGIVVVKSSVLSDILEYIKKHKLKYWDDYYKFHSSSFNEMYYRKLDRVLEIDSKDNIDYINSVIRSRNG